MSALTCPTTGPHTIWHLGDDVDTDALAPGAWMQFGIDVIAQHCLVNLVPTFAKVVRPGDVIVAGKNFGIGSSREQAAAALVHLGVGTVVAASYGGLFFRNAFNLGLVLLTCPELEVIRKNEPTEFYLRGKTVVLTSGEEVECDPVPDFLLDMARAGGLLPSLKRRLNNRSDTSKENSI